MRKSNDEANRGLAERLFQAMNDEAAWEKKCRENMKRLKQENKEAKENNKHLNDKINKNKPYVRKNIK